MTIKMTSTQPMHQHNIDGHVVAFGNTLEGAHAIVFGREPRDPDADHLFNHLTGTGRVDAKPGDYKDALGKNYKVYLLHTESTGAVAPGLSKLLLACARAVKLAPGSDSTVYGSNPSNPRSFYAHHLASISCAIVCADARTLLNRAASDALAATLRSAHA